MSEDRIQNRILAALPRLEYERIRPALELEQMPSGKALYEAGQIVTDVYFLNTGMASLVTVTDEGATIEVGVIGNEGMVGVLAILGMNRMPHDTMMQLPGNALRMKFTRLTAELNRPGTLKALLLRHMCLLHLQVARSVVCNRFHNIESRLCRWLLMSRERVDSNTVALTREFLSAMWGVARPIVSLTARTLQNAGLIEYRKGLITIVDLDGLKATACECYEVVKTQAEQILLD